MLGRVLGECWGECWGGCWERVLWEGVKGVNRRL